MKIIGIATKPTLYALENLLQKHIDELDQILPAKVYETDVFYAGENLLWIEGTPYQRDEFWHPNLLHIEPVSVTTEKPTIGIIPRKLWMEQRLSDIKTAIERRIETNGKIPVVWVEEYNHMVDDNN